MPVVKIVKETFVSDIFDFLETFHLKEQFLKDYGLKSLEEWEYPIPDEEVILKYLDKMPQNYVVFYDSHNEGDFWIAQIEPECKHLITISEEDLWAIAEKEGIKIPEDKKQDVIQTAKKFLESYCYDGAYNVWDALKDAIKTALEG